MSGIEHTDAAGKIDVALAIGIPDFGIECAHRITLSRMTHATRNSGFTAYLQLCIFAHLSLPAA